MAERNMDGSDYPGELTRGPITMIVTEGGTTYRIGPGFYDEIRAFTKTGMAADLHFVAVIVGGAVLIEIAQHQLKGIYYG